MKTTQCKRLLEYLRRNDSVTPMDAWQQLGIYRLGARIWDLKKDGWKIDKTMVLVKNRFGEACYVAGYSLEEEGQIEMRGIA